MSFRVYEGENNSMNGVGSSREFSKLRRAIASKTKKQIEHRGRRDTEKTEKVSGKERQDTSLIYLCILWGEKCDAIALVSRV
jgi:hypothetical protein